MAKEWITVREAADLWGLTDRRISELCRLSRIPGARKDGRSWLIPAGAERPSDMRFRTGRYSRREEGERLPLPIGISDYRQACSEYYYVDKTMLIKEFLDERPKVALFTRPRRFGKTLAMDMLRTFFERSEEDTGRYFRDKKVWACGEKYRRYQGKYPVLFLTFKDVKYDTWAESLESIRSLLRREFARHEELRDSERCSEVERSAFRELVDGTASSVAFAGSLALVSQMLDEHYGTAPIIIIDEYDVPIQQGHARGFYDQVTPFLRNLFSGAFKDNRHLAYGFLTGVLRVAKESIFSGLNNLALYSVLDDRYSQYFGFTPDEVRDMAAYYGVPEKFGEICSWYDGYRFGGTDIFNPWSVVSYFSKGCVPKAYWMSTGSNDIIGEVIAGADRDICENLTALVRGGSFSAYIDTGVVYPQIKSNPSSIYSFLVVAGYLKVVSRSESISGDTVCELALPNRELAIVYSKEILRQLEPAIPAATAISIQQAIYAGDGAKLQKLMRDLLMRSASYLDTAAESFYHGLMLGLCAVAGEAYVTSNREAGEGRYDIQMSPKNSALPGILIELKADRGDSEGDLEELAQAALRQMRERQYAEELKGRGVSPILRYGVAFRGKAVAVAADAER